LTDQSTPIHSGVFDLKRRVQPEQGRRNLLVKHLAAAALAIFLSFSAHADAPSACGATVRLGVPDFDRSPSERRGSNMTAVELEIVQRIGQEAGVEVVGHAQPYVRALSEFRSGKLDGILIAEGAGRAAIRRATRVPMLRLEFVRIRPENRTPALISLDVGIIRGMAPEAGGALPGESVKTVNSYVALLKLLKSGKVRQIVAARPSIDAYLNDDPELRDGLATMERIDLEPLSLHLSPGLADPCRLALADAARVIARRDLPGILRQALPGLDISPFLLNAGVDQRPLAR
jgi:ABC-type amino acid transport substrate-binding protein